MQNQYNPNIPNDQMVRWGGGAMPADAGTYMDNMGNPMSSMDLVQSQPQFASNNSLARISNNRALVPTKNPYGGNFNAAQGWGGFGDDNQLVATGFEENGAQDDNIEELEERAQKAKREAHAKRKQIPPFVQKLSR